MSMDDDAWTRHANPMSVYSRFSCLPLLVLAIWSRVWLGLWCLLPIALAVFWTWLNPRLFDPPESLDSWASRGVLGERRFLERATRPIPEPHQRMAHRLTALSGIGMLMLVYGLIALDLRATLSGLLLAILAKLWFVDRMVWLEQEMREW